MRCLQFFQEGQGLVFNRGRTGREDLAGKSRGRCRGSGGGTSCNDAGSGGGFSDRGSSERGRTMYPPFGSKEWLIDNIVGLRGVFFVSPDNWLLDCCYFLL
jgi:hypothetical protein